MKSNKQGSFTNPVASIIQIMFLRECNERLGKNLQLTQYSNDVIRRLMQYLDIFYTPCKIQKVLNNYDLIDRKK